MQLVFDIFAGRMQVWNHNKNINKKQKRKKTSTESTHLFIDSESQCRAPWILPSWTLFFGDRLPWARCTPQLSTDGLSRDEFSAAKRVTTTFHQWRNGRGCDASVFFVHKKGAFHLFCPSENMCCFSCEKWWFFSQWISCVLPLSCLNIFLWWRFPPTQHLQLLHSLWWFFPQKN